MKAYLLYAGRDFDFTAGLPAGHQDLIQDLELATLLRAMATGDKFLYEVSAKVLLASLDDPDAIRYRQRVLADCLARPEVIRQMHAVAVGALQDKRGLWGRLRRQLPECVIQPLRRGQAPGSLRGPPAAAPADRRSPCRDIPLRRADNAVRHLAARAG